MARPCELGEWRLNDKFFQDFQLSGLEDLTSTNVPFFQVNGKVDDFSATVDDRRKKCEEYVKIVPWGPDCINSKRETMSRTVQDGDILVFVQPKMALNENDAIGSLKQRGTHAEICYFDDSGQAKQVSVWHEGRRDEICDKAIEQDETIPGYGKIYRKSWIMHIYRLNVPGKDIQRHLKQVKLWKEVYNKHVFSMNGPGNPNYLDPADFTTKEELREIAKGLLRRTPGETPITQYVPEVTCVQWCYLLLCLALNFPLSKNTLESLCVSEEYKSNWQEKLKDANKELEGLDIIPFLPYTAAQVLQEFLNTYAGGESLLDVLNDKNRRDLLDTLLISHLSPKLKPFATKYLDDIKATKNIESLSIMKSRFILPISFFTEARAATKKDPASPWFQYVATALYQDYLNEG